MSTTKRIILASMLLASTLWLAWNVGILSTDGENENYRSVFTKKNGTLKIFFRNPYLSVAASNGKWLDPQDRWIHGTRFFEEFSNYCWYRFGIADITSPESTHQCLVSGTSR